MQIEIRGYLKGILDENTLDVATAAEKLKKSSRSLTIEEMNAESVRLKQMLEESQSRLQVLEKELKHAKASRLAAKEAARPAAIQRERRDKSRKLQLGAAISCMVLTSLISFGFGRKSGASARSHPRSEDPQKSAVVPPEQET